MMTPKGDFDTEKIYSKQLKVVVKTSNADERCSHLTVTGELSSTSGSVFRKDFIIRITDEEDPLLFYHLKLNDEDYKSLQVQQGLLVDFTSFPQKFVDLLELCREEELKSSPRFVLHLMHSSLSDLAVFNVVETNPFKHLVHLSLKLALGTDHEVKKYLASCVNVYKSKNERLQSQLNSTELDLHGRLRDATEQLSKKQTEIEKLRSELKEQAHCLHERFDMHSSQEKGRFTQMQHDLKERYERDLREAEYNHSRLVGRLEANAASLEAQVRELTEKCCRLDATVNELRNRVITGDNEARLSREELQELRKENLKLETLKGELERSVNQFGSRVSTLEHELRTKESHLLRAESLLQSVQEQKVKCNEDLDMKQALLSKRETAIKTLSEELNKGNEIIRKLQAEIKSLHAKLVLRSKVTQEQEKVVTDREKQVELLQSQVSSLEATLQQKSDEIKQMNETLSTAQSKLEENQKVLKTNENVINWLNKQLNESQLIQQRSGGVGVASSVQPAVPFGASSSSALGLFATSTPAGVVSPNPLFPTGPVLQYNPNQATLQVGSKKPTFGAIPEENPLTKSTSPSSNKENAAPLHEKYLQASNNGTSKNSGPSAASGSNKARPLNGVRLPRTSIAPIVPNRLLGRQSSAYFPP